MIVETIPGVKGLSLEQKWQLANELWEEIEEQQAALPTNAEIVAIVQQRFADFERDPRTAMTLEEFKRRYHLP